MAHEHTEFLDLYYPDMSIPITETIGEFAQGFVDNMAILDNAVTGVKGNLTAGSTKISIGGTGTDAVIGSGVSVDVAQGNLDHGSIGGLSDDDHTQYVKHSLATAVSDFLVGAGTSTFTFVKKTLAEVKTILGLGSAAYTASTDYAVSGKGVTNGDSHDHAGGDGAQVDHGGLGGLSDDDHSQYLRADAARALSADWDIGNGRMIQADKIRARDGDGLALYEDGGAGIFVKDGGNVGIGTITQLAKLALNGGLHVGGDSDPGDNNLLVDGTATIGSMTVAGFVKNAATTGLLSGGNSLAVSDIPAMTSAEFATKISDETGTDKVVFNTSPALITPTINGVNHISTIKSADAVVDTWYDAIRLTTNYDASGSGRLTVTVHARESGGYYTTGMRVYRVLRYAGSIALVEDGSEFTKTIGSLLAHAEARVVDNAIQIRITVTGTAENYIRIGYNLEWFTLWSSITVTNLL